MSDSNLVQVGRFYDSTQAHIIRGILENNDIQCFMFDEHHNASAWHLGIAIGGTRLMVHKDNAEKAIEILAEEIEVEKQHKGNKNQIIRKPYFKTIIGTIIGFLVSAPSIRPTKKKNDET